MTAETITQISTALRALAKDKTKTSVIRDTLADIEHCKAAGISNKKIVETLGNYGLVIDEKSFASLLSRERARAKRKSESTKKQEKSVENV